MMTTDKNFGKQEEFSHKISLKNQEELDSVLQELQYRDDLKNPDGKLNSDKLAEVLIVDTEGNIYLLDEGKIPPLTHSNEKPCFVYLDNNAKEYKIVDLKNIPHNCEGTVKNRDLAKNLARIYNETRHRFKKDKILRTDSGKYINLFRLVKKYILNNRKTPKNNNSKKFIIINQKRFLSRCF